MLNLTSVQIEYDPSNVDQDSSSVLCDSIIKANIVVTSNFPGPVHCDEVLITVKKMPVEEKPVVMEQKSKEISSTSSATLTISDTLFSIFDSLPVREQRHLKQDGSLSSVALVYPNISQILR